MMGDKGDSDVIIHCIWVLFFVNLNVLSHCDYWHTVRAI